MYDGSNPGIQNARTRPSACPATKSLGVASDENLEIPVQRRPAMKWTAEHGCWINTQLEDRRLTKRAVASHIGTAESTLHKWISGDQSPVDKQSWGRPAFEKLGKLLGYSSSQEMLEAINDTLVGKPPTLPSLSAAAMEIYRHVDLRGAAYAERLIRSLGDASRSALEECFVKSCLVRRHRPEGHDLVALPHFALAAELAESCASVSELSVRLDLPLQFVEQLIDLLDEHIEPALKAKLILSSPS